MTISNCVLLMLKKIPTEDSDCCICFHDARENSTVAVFSACGHWVCSTCSCFYGPKKFFQTCPLCCTELKNPPINIEFILYKQLPDAPVPIYKKLPDEPVPIYKKLPGVPLLCAGGGGGKLTHVQISSNAIRFDVYW